MRTFEYTVCDELGLHARPAGRLVRCAKSFLSRIRVICNGKSGDAKRLIGLMKIEIKKGERVLFEINGDDEKAAEEKLQRFCRDNL
ncbi:MAG: HPr family phosphocarrier protein [Treponema sp.]|jgi:phosphocarrier protein|nr:HPr family phosphocarrier protein [Treponema sp.]